MPVKGKAVISYTYTVRVCHPEFERANDGAVFIRAFIREEFYPIKFDFHPDLLSVSPSKLHKMNVGDVRSWRCREGV